LLLLKAPSGVGNEERVPPSPADYGVWGSVVSSPQRGPGPKTILVLFGGARTALVAILVANFAFLSQGLR